MKPALRPPYLLTAALSGALFGAGLYIAQMTNPLKVLRFLDFTAIPSGWSNCRPASASSNSNGVCTKTIGGFSTFLAALAGGGWNSFGAKSAR